MPSCGPPAFGGLLALVARQQLDHGLTDAVEIRPELDEDLRSNALTLTDETQQDVLSSDVVMAELKCFAK